MERHLSILAVASFLLFAISCSKETNQPAVQATGDTDNIYRDWTKKGKRKPAPRPWEVLKQKQEIEK